VQAGVQGGAQVGLQDGLQGGLQMRQLLDEMARSLTVSNMAQRDAMLVQLADLFSGVSHLLDPSGLETFDTLFVSLVPACTAGARSQLSQRIAPDARAPIRLIRRLAFDDDIAVARPVLKLSPLLLDDDLVALATVKSLDHLLAIAERASLSTVVTDLLLTRADGRIRIALVGNPGARVSERGWVQIAEAAIDDDLLHEAVQARAEGVSAREAPAPQGEAPSADTTRSAAGPEGQGPQAAPQAPRAEGGPRADGEVIALLERGDVNGALAWLATALAVPTAPVMRAFAVDIHGGFLAYARAVGLGWGAVELFVKRRYEAGNMPPRLSRAQRDFESLSAADARRVVDLLVQHAGRKSN
jgi:hypothetical protein